ncbi:MAG TPA: DivIVA domain-containing protein [Acidimicrobiales bacterium]|nr:DivIVA domain-containing protein [Acidimicrobiales bacterium]
MDSAQSALDSLRTVEFRETLKGYHRDDVDEYLEKAAVEAEGLQEQFRQANERLRQAGERIGQLEAALERQPEQHAPAAEAPAIADETLQRTLVLAQQFVDQTKADSEARASKTLSDAEEQSRVLISQAESRASHIASEAERKLREEVARLEAARTQLSGDVEKMARHLDGERNRLRSALSEIIKWVDDNVQPASALGARPSDGSGGAPSGRGPAVRQVQPVDQSGRPGGGPVSGQVTSVRTSETTLQTLDGGSSQPPQF